jgi:hypothetical protein
MPPDPDLRLDRARRLAHWLDDGIRLPGGFRIGADPIFGLVPVVGDLLGAILGGIIVVQGARLRVPLSTLLRMVLNLVVDELIGAIPVAGDLYDAVARANLRNIALLERALADPGRAARSDRWYLVAVFATLGALLIGVVALSILIARWLIGWLIR